MTPYQLWRKISKCNLIKTNNSILQIKHLEILKIHFFSNKDHMPNYWPEVKTLKLFFQRTAMLRSVIYKTYFVFDTFRLSDEIFTKMKIIISPQETIIFLLDFYKFFTGVETSSFGNFKPNGIRTSPLRILKTNKDFFSYRKNT